MGRKAMHDASLFRGSSQQLCINLIMGKITKALFPFILLAHTGPDVAVNYIGIAHGSSRIDNRFERPFGGMLAKRSPEPIIEAIALGGCQSEANAHRATAERQGTGYVVSVANNDDGSTFELPEQFLLSQQICACLSPH